MSRQDAKSAKNQEKKRGYLVSPFGDVKVESSGTKSGGMPTFPT
jgi:hypothetical protein